MSFNQINLHLWICFSVSPKSFNSAFFSDKRTLRFFSRKNWEKTAGLRAFITNILHLKRGKRDNIVNFKRIDSSNLPFSSFVSLWNDITKMTYYGRVFVIQRSSSIDETFMLCSWERREIPALWGSRHNIHVCKQHIGHHFRVRTLNSKEMAVFPNNFMLNELWRKYSREDC